jgi:hypothetical protein
VPEQVPINSTRDASPEPRLDAGLPATDADAGAMGGLDVSPPKSQLDGGPPVVQVVDSSVPDAGLPGTVPDAGVMEDCNALAAAFDNTLQTNWASVCPVNAWVGARLLAKSVSYDSWYHRYVTSLTMAGLEKQTELQITSGATTVSQVPYEVGRFYKYDVGGMCRLIFSSASSGMFYDPGLQALKPVTCLAP